jgi:hypothetical protein
LKIDMSPEAQRRKLIDEFLDMVKARGLSVAGKIEEVGVFGDFVWPPRSGDPFNMMRFATEDPAFVVIGYSRWVGFWRIENEIRYYAAPNVPGAQAWYWTGEDANRVAAVDAEIDESEIGMLPMVEDVLLLTMEYLSGSRLAEIPAPRSKPYYLAAC